MESNSSFFPTESSGMAPFFLMFGWEVAVKHNILASESPKYLGTEDNMINIELMSKLYLVVAHNLNKARKARDGNKKQKITKIPEQLKIGDNVLVRDHTSKALQPKYKEFYITGLLGKNQVEIKDNYSHTTKVHRRDVKKIPMSKKVCQLYEEEQIVKVRQGRKAIPDNKMPDLGWDAMEELNTQDIPSITTKGTEKTAKTFLEILRPQLQEIFQIGKNMAQAILIATGSTSKNGLFKRTSKTYRKIVQRVIKPTEDSQ